jgi:hypothetical protein
MICELVFPIFIVAISLGSGKEWVPVRGKWKMGIDDAQSAKEKGRQEKEGGPAR